MITHPETIRETELVSARTPLTKPGPVYPATIQYKRSDKGMQVSSEDAIASPGTRSEGPW